MTVAYFCFHRSNTEQVPRETVVTAGLLGISKMFCGLGGQYVMDLH